MRFGKSPRRTLLLLWEGPTKDAPKQSLTDVPLPLFAEVAVSEEETFLKKIRDSLVQIVSCKRPRERLHEITLAKLFASVI